MFQKLLANKHLSLRDSRLSLIRPSGGLGLSTQKNNNKARADYEPRSAHGRVVKKKVSYILARLARSRRECRDLADTAEISP